MALSADTQAIIDRLKAEGDLIRNSGTNSMRSVSIKLDKFEDIFGSISTNISEQTKIMQLQAGIAQDNLEKQRNQEQFDEIQKKEKEKTKEESDTTNDKIDKIGDKIESALSMKSVLGGLKDFAIGAAGMFIGYNFLKGFIDQKYDGAWTKMEGGIGDLGRSLGEIDVTKLSKNFNDFVDSLPSLTSMITSITTTFEEFKTMWNEYSWGDIILGIFNAMSGVTLAILGLKTFGPAIRAVLARRMAAAGATAAEIAATRGALTGAAALGEAIGIDKSGRAIYRNAAGAITDDAGRVLSMADIPDHLKPQMPGERNFARNAAGELISNRTGNRLTGGALATAEATEAADRRLIREAEEFAARQAAAQAAARMAAQNAASDSRLIATATAAAADGSWGKRLAARLGSRIASEAQKRAWKIAALAVPGVGAVVGAGFALWNLFKGDFTSASLQGTSIFLPTVTGTAVDITSIATEIFFLLYTNEDGSPASSGYNPANPDHNAFMTAIGEYCMEAVKEYLQSEEGRNNVNEYDEFSGMYNDGATSSPQSAADARDQAEFERMAWNYQGPNGQSYAREASQATTDAIQQLLSDPNNQGNYTFDPSSRRMYYTPNGGIRQDLGRIEDMAFSPSLATNSNLALVGAGGAGGGAPIIIDAKTIAPSNFSIADAGTSAQVLNYSGGGSGGGSGVPNLLAYGLTSQFG